MKGNGGIELEPTGGLEPSAFSLLKEVLEEHFPIGAPMRSNAKAIANNRCPAALPRKCHVFASANPVDAQTCFACLSVRWPVATRFASMSWDAVFVVKEEHDSWVGFPRGSRLHARPKRVRRPDKSGI